MHNVPWGCNKTKYVALFNILVQLYNVLAAATHSFIYNIFLFFYRIDSFILGSYFFFHLDFTTYRIKFSKPYTYNSYIKLCGASEISGFTWIELNNWKIKTTSMCSEEKLPFANIIDNKYHKKKMAHIHIWRQSVRPEKR